MKTMRLAAVFIMLSALVLAAGCAAVQADTQEETLSITGLGEDIIVPISEIIKLDAYEGEVKGADSQGDPVEYTVKGSYFADLLENLGYSQEDLAGIRIVATDGYSIEVSKEILKARDVILAYEMDGKPLDADNAPLRVFIPEERAMYWVKMVQKIEVIEVEAPLSVGGVYIMESLYGSGDYEDYTFIAQTYKVLDTNKILGDYPGTKGGVVLMTASDGLEKNETLENFYKGVISMTGQDSPQFFSNVLPGGMFVKNLKLFKYGGNAFYFITSTIKEAEALGESVTLESIAVEAGLTQAEEYTLYFGDGQQMIIDAAQLSSWVIGIENEKVSAANGSVESQIVSIKSNNQ
ncbi:MAG: molybdopterin-dependent oxidoreductase [Christensenellales bacterium]|jgi:hypothetical protein